jgi:hypothetical protein
VSAGIHWGTFLLAEEQYLEPRALLAKEAALAGLDCSGGDRAERHEFAAGVHGRSFDF